MNQTIQQNFPQQNERFYYMDALRGILMMLGVLIHSAAVFSDMPWVIKNYDTSPYLGLLVSFLHAFRLPVFFVISGFFCYLTLSRYHPAKFLRVRMQRLLVPMLSVGLLLNPLQFYALDLYYGFNPTIFSYLISKFYWMNGHGLAHLWFLAVLIIYFLAAALIYVVAQGPCKWVSTQFAALVEKNSTPVILLMPLVLYAIEFFGFRLAALVHLSGDLADALFEVMGFLGYFIAGAMMGHNHNVLIRLSQLRWWVMLVALAAILIKVYLVKSDGVFLGKVVWHYMDNAIPWLLSLICIGLFRRYLSRPTKIFAYLSDASYSIYLFHYICVVLLSIWIIPMSLPWLLKFIIVLGLTILISLAAHHFVVLRWPIFRYLFNGRPVTSNQANNAPKH